MIAVAFACGLGLGVVLGAAMWSGALWLSRQVITRAQQKQVAEWRQTQILHQKKIEKAKADIKSMYGNEMTQEQERIMEQELGKLYREFPNPQIPKDA